MDQLTASPRHPRWVDLSEEHKRVKTQLTEALSNFKNHLNAPASSIVGAYGSGKSELMCWAFKYCWTELRLPALIINFESLLNGLPDHPINPSEFAAYISNFVSNQLEGLRSSLELADRPKDQCLAYDLRPDETTLHYLRDLFQNPELTEQDAQLILGQKRAVLFLDEIEQKYAELSQRIKSDDQAPLRETLEKVEKGLVPYYLVMSFALTSAYEATRGADIRRWNTLPIPIPDPAELISLVSDQRMVNLLWWASRGLPGIGIMLSQNWIDGMSRALHLRDLYKLSPAHYENLPIVETNVLGQISGEIADGVALELLKQIQPVLVSSLSYPNFNLARLNNDDEWPRFFTLQASKEKKLVRKEEIISCFQKDLEKSRDGLNSPNVDFTAISYYLAKILSALADNQDRIVLGGWPKNDHFAQAFIAPLLILVQDLILEFSAEQQGAPDTINFLDKVMDQCAITGEESKDTYQLIRRFPKTVDLFEEVRDDDPIEYISLSPHALSLLFPRVVGRPLLNLEPTAKATIDDQRNALEAYVAGSGNFLTSTISTPDGEAQIVFFVGQSTLPKLQEYFFHREKRQEYLRRNRSYLLIDLLGEQNYIFDERLNSDISILTELNKIQWDLIEEKRITDFIISLWHNHAQLSMELWEPELFKVFDSALAKPKLSKSNRRKIEFYRKRIREKLEILARSAIQSYKSKISSLFDPEDESFPQRINDAILKVKMNRAIEQVALAFDLQFEKNRTLHALSSLRSLSELRKLTENPHAYNNFLESYTVAARGSTIREGVSLEHISSAIHLHPKWTGELLDISSRLGLTQFRKDQDTRDATDQAPILYLFEGVEEEKEVFLRGLSLFSYIKHNRQLFEQELHARLAEVDRLIQQLSALKSEIEDFNSEIGKDVLSTAFLETYLGELDSLNSLLKDAAHLPPATLFITHHVSAIALRSLAEKRERWTSDKGFFGWQSSYRSLLGWQSEIDEIQQDLEEAFKTNQNIKESLIGKLPDLQRQLCKPVKDRATEVLRHLDKGLSLADAEGEPRKPDLTLFEEALSQALQKKDETIGKTEEADQLISALLEIRADLNDLVNRLGA